MIAVNQPLHYALVMIIAGIGIPVMASLNGGLGGKLQSPTLATVILLGVSFLGALVFLLFNEGVPSFELNAEIPKYYFLGGLFVIFYILSITWVAPKFGVGNAISFVLLGQLISMSIIDHFSFLGAPYTELTFERVVGLLLMIVGVYLIVRKSA